jgi:hypothetical protein
MTDNIINIPIFGEETNPLEPQSIFDPTNTGPFVPVRTPGFGVPTPTYNPPNSRNGPSNFYPNFVPQPNYGPPPGFNGSGLYNGNTGTNNNNDYVRNFSQFNTLAMGVDKLIGVKTEGQRYFDSLRPYFNVKKRYVQKKLGILLLPYVHKSWHRSQDTHMDFNTPDLYIPLMSVITYILLVGFFMGTQFRFTPDVLGKTLTTVMMILIFEVLTIKGSTLIWPHQTPLLDILSYSGYKFVGITVNVITGLILGTYGFYVAFILTS